MRAVSAAKSASMFFAIVAALTIGCGGDDNAGDGGSGGMAGSGGTAGDGGTGGDGATGGTGGVGAMACEGVECLSFNDCVLDGMCEQATGECNPGENVPEGELCDLLGVDDGFCNGAGACVECNDVLDCPESDQCLVSTCVDTTCGEEAGPDDIACDLLGAGDGVCDNGECVEPPACNSDADCDNGNVCTIDTCPPNNECNFEPNDGESCDLVGTGDGICAGGVCVECLVGAECDDDNVCTIDSCLPNNECTFEPNDGESCDLVGTGDGICAGGVCVEPPPECVIDDDCEYEQTCEDNTCVGPKLVFREDFESGIGMWYPDRGVWQVGEATSGPGACFGGSQQCAGTVLDGNYPARTSSRLISRPLVLPAVSENEELHLRFQNWFNLARNTLYSDTGQVQVSVRNAEDTFDAWQNVGSWVGTQSGGWTIKAVDLTAYAGKTVRIGFLLVKGSADRAPGWFIDDIEFVAF